MKGFLALVLAGGLLLTGCSGLPTSREMGDMALLRTMGVDAVAQGVEVTGSTGPRARGTSGGRGGGPGAFGSGGIPQRCLPGYAEPQ